MKKTLQLLDDNAERWLMLVFYSYIVFIIIVEVLRRFLLDFSSLWGEEAARFFFIYLGWVGASSAVKERAHIRFDTLLSVLPEKAHGYVYLFGDLVTLVFAGYAIYWSLHSLHILIAFDALTPALRVSQAWFFAAVPLGFTLMVVRLLQSMWRDIRDIRAGREPYGGKLLFD